MRGSRIAVLAIALAAVPAPAAGHGGGLPRLTGYDGSLPFACEVQQAGTGVDFADPAADPFCVEYDKRHQNVVAGGVVEFLALEPARVAAASPKCFYHQRDHWRGSIVQEDERTKTYEWDGSYFFDKAHGLGGVYVENFNVNGQTGDPRELPGFPEEWKPHFGRGRGGVQSSEFVRADPRCVEREHPAGPPVRDSEPCPARGGRVGRGIGGVALGATRARVERRIGPPARSARGVLRWCLADGGKLLGVTRGGRVALALTTSPAFEAGGVRAGASSRSARAALRGERTLARRGRGIVVLARRTRAGTLLVGLRGRRVAYLALARHGLGAAQVGRLLDRSR